jgi:heat shock transcription factor 1
MASFVRQLNMYGFHKVMSVESGGLKGDKDEIEFAHLFFLRGQEHLLDQIKRKVSTAPKSGGLTQQFVPRIKSEKVIIKQLPTPEVSQREELVNEFLCEVGELKVRQEDLDGKLDTMRNENEALWGEVLNLRQKHGQQQKIVNKLIQFLVALVQPRMGTGIKRKFRQGLQLAIEEPSPNAKEPRLELPEEGPVIQEISEEITGTQLSDLLSKVPVGSVHEITITSPTPAAEDPPRTAQTYSMAMEPIDQSETGSSQSKYRMVDPASMSPSLMQMKKENDLTPSKRSLLNREISKDDFDIDISSMQKELDNLKEILSSQITLDTSLVSNLFTAEQDNVSCMNLFNENLLDQEEESSIAEQTDSDLKLVTYNPSLFELAEEQNNAIGIDEDDLMQTPPKSSFEIELHTPNIREHDQQLLREFFVK